MLPPASIDNGIEVEHNLDEPLVVFWFQFRLEDVLLDGPYWFWSRFAEETDDCCKQDDMYSDGDMCSAAQAFALLLPRLFFVEVANMVDFLEVVLSSRLPHA
jgi:hypothetical protein